MAKFWNFKKNEDGGSATDSEQDFESTSSNENEREEQLMDDTIDTEVTEDEEIEGSAEVHDLYDESQEPVSEADRWKKQYLSLMAEFDNFRKRTRKDMDQIRVNEKTNVLKPLLESLDNFERAFSLEEAEETPWSIGIKDSFEHLKRGFDGLGVHTIEALGEPFDPDLHEAVGCIDSNDFESQTIAEVLQNGYMLEDGTVIRYARVIVAN